jgi:hypothetical protein
MGIIFYEKFKAWLAEDLKNHNVRKITKKDPEGKNELRGP